MKKQSKNFLLSQSTWSFVVVAVLLIVAVVLGVVYWQPLSDLFSDKERVEALVSGAGIWGPLVFIGVQFLQILITPIPGQAVGVLAGALFGPLLGTVYSMLGAFIGFTAVFMISRKLGRPFVERFVEKRHLEKFDYLTNSNGPLVFFLIFLLPGFPDDIICYLAGLSPISLRTFILVSLAGRFPGFLVLSLLGAGIAGADIRLIVGIVTAFVVLGVLAYWQRARLEKWIRKLGASRGSSRK